MNKIRIKNFGPIKEGYQEEGGWMDIKKVTVFIGNQGSGKSTVAKVVSTLIWMEKALNRGDIEEPKSFVDFHFSRPFEYSIFLNRFLRFLSGRRLMQVSSKLIAQSKAEIALKTFGLAGSNLD